MGLGLTSKNISCRNMSGFITDSVKKFTRTSDSDFDDMTTVTVIAYLNVFNITGVAKYANPLHLFYDAADDVGFTIFTHIANTGAATNAYMADGSGTANSVSSAGGSTTAFEWAGNSLHSQRGTPLIAMIARFAVDETNEQMAATIHSGGISVTKGNNDAANLGTIGTNGEITISNGLITCGDTGSILKVSLWKSALSDANILKLVGLTGSSIDDDNGFQSNFHMATRFTSYSDLGVTQPHHEWDFTNAALGSAITIEDTGSTGGKDLTRGGTSTAQTPIIGYIN